LTSCTIGSFSRRAQRHEKKRCPSAEGPCHEGVGRSIHVFTWPRLPDGVTPSRVTGWATRGGQRSALLLRPAPEDGKSGELHEPQRESGARDITCCFVCESSPVGCRARGGYPLLEVSRGYAQPLQTNAGMLVVAVSFSNRRSFC
jgi:hypothetical protein